MHFTVSYHKFMDAHLSFPLLQCVGYLPLAQTHLQPPDGKRSRIINNTYSSYQLGMFAVTGTMKWPTQVSLHTADPYP